MAHSVRINYNTRLPAGGKDSAGVAKNNKRLVGGRINITSYTAGGEVITPLEFGLDVLDQIFFNVESVNNAVTEFAAANPGWANYDRTAQRVVIISDATTANVTGQAAVVRFLAMGDSNATPDLT